MLLDPYIKQFVGCDSVFLDTTYCNPKFVFPLQDESVEYVVDVINSVGGKESVLFLVATYVIGKEKILLEISRKCGRKVYVDERKMEIMRVLGYGESGVFTRDEKESDVHVVGWNVLGETWPYFRPNFGRMKEIMVDRGYSKVVGFVPTGWTYEVKRNKFAVKCKDELEIHLVPYSEHSNYEELREYVKFLKPKKVVPTVGMDVEKVDSKHASKMRKYFCGLIDETANKKEFLSGFHRGVLDVDEKVQVCTGSGINPELDKDREVKLSETKADVNSSLGVVLDTSDCLEEPGLQELNILDDEETEKLIEQLCDNLPAWVTREQMLNLISRSRKSIVDAVSIFYECETEYHDQVVSVPTSASQSLKISLDVSASASKLDTVKGAISLNPESKSSYLNDFASMLKPSSSKNIFHENTGDISLSQNSKSPNKKPSVKSSISPGKRKKSTNHKPKKKAKVSTKMETSGSKQSTITKFFNKISSNLSQVVEDTDSKPESPKDEGPLPIDDTKSYAEELSKDACSYREATDQFIKIINGNESSRSYAASILEKAEGDINMALDIYYSNNEGGVGVNEESVPFSRGSSSALEKTATQGSADLNDELNRRSSEEHIDKTRMHDFTIKKLLKEHSGSTFVSLPPEKYNPVEHGAFPSLFQNFGV